ncbi:heterocycloanthracin/sonorensin family bacteriocin, partial [Neobacillus niacini]
MHNFQNGLQSLGMDHYQVGELIPIDYQSQDALQVGDMRRCGG